VDWAAVATGIGAIVTAVGGITLAIREVRRRERRAATKTINALEDDLNECQTESVALHRQVYALRKWLADRGLDGP